ncbi:MAG: vWA domain-containing protein, partial [Parvularcula sp.]
MLARVDGEPKVDTARRVAETFLETVAVDRRAGLVVFGQSRAGSCDDIETLVPLSRDREAVRDALAKIKPRGVTPLSSALEKVAKDYRNNSRALTIFLISDGGDQCFRDPCALAKEMKAANASVVTNVVGLGEGAEHDLPQLKCIAEATGGRFVTVDEVPELAAIEPVDPTPPPLAIGPIRVTLRAVDAEKQPLPASVRIAWSVTPLNADGSRGDRAVFKTGTTLLIDLPPGRYLVTADQGEDARQSFELTVRGNEPITRDVVFTNGTVTLTAHLTKGAPPLERPVIGWTIRKQPQDNERPKQVASEAGAKVSFTLPAGRYEGLARAEDISVPFRMTVIANETREKQVVLNAGLISVSGPRGSAWSLYRPEANDRLTRAASEVAEKTVFLVPAGDYVVELRIGEKQRRERITLPAGETLTLKMGIDDAPRLDRPAIDRPVLERLPLERLPIERVPVRPKPADDPKPADPPQPKRDGN